MRHRSTSNLHELHTNETQDWFTGVAANRAEGTVRTFLLEW